MIFRWLKRIVLFIIIILVLFFILLATPRIWSALNPDKPPVGYGSEIPVYIAAWVGLEKLVNLNPEIPSGISEIKNIEYKNINGKSLQLDMYVPDNVNQPMPLLVFIHGGSWKWGKRSDYLAYLIDFAKKGYITATVSYRLLGDSIYPACVEDISDAVNWIFDNGQNYGYDTSRIALVGGSAGAHLALLTAYGWKRQEKERGTTSAASMHRIKAVVDIYGPYDLTTEYSRNHPRVKNFIGHSWEESPDLYLEASPQHYLDKNDPPTMILHGTSDQLVPISQSDSLASRLRSLGISYVYCRVPGWPHVMDIVKRVNDFSQVKMNDFFGKYLK